MYKVFINNKPLYLLTMYNKVDSEILEDNRIEFVNKDSIQNAIDLLSENNNIQKLYLICKSENEVLKKMKSIYTYIKAAGGIVQNKNENILLIYRNKYWDFPKGKLEKGEKKKMGAIREVKEECGLKSCEILKSLPSTYHMYRIKGNWILKKTYWYSMFSDQKNLIPQLEEGIEIANWFSKKDALIKSKENMFKSVNELFHKYLED